MAASKETQRVKEYWEAHRTMLKAVMGGRCTNCGVTESLEFDHIKPSGFDLAQWSMSRRMRHYLEEYENGNLQLLCRSCNASKSHRPTVQTRMEVTSGRPF